MRKFLFGCLSHVFAPYPWWRWCQTLGWSRSAWWGKQLCSGWFSADSRQQSLRSSAPQKPGIRGEPEELQWQETQTTHNCWRQLWKVTRTASTRVLLHVLPVGDWHVEKSLGKKKTKQTFFLGTSCEGKKSLLLNNEISISIMEWNSLWSCTDWQSCPSVGKPLMHPHVFVSLSHLLYVTHLLHGHEWPSSHRHWTVPPSDLQT